MQAMLEINDLGISFGGLHAVDNFHVSIEKGELYGLIGPNGAGKTTIFNLLTGVYKPDEGIIRLDGEDITGKNSAQIVEKGLMMVPEGRRIFPNLTVLENLKIGAYLRKDDLTPDIERVYGYFPRLKERSWQEGGTLSGGEQQMLAVGRALMGRPKLLMMDEPSLGLAPIVVQGIFEIIRQINEAGTTVLLIEQNANMALHVADRAYVIENGKISMEGTGKELLEDEKVRAAYLGTASAKN